MANGLDVELFGLLGALHDEPKPRRRVLAHQLIDHPVGDELIGDLHAQELFSPFFQQVQFFVVLDDGFQRNDLAQGCVEGQVLEAVAGLGLATPVLAQKAEVIHWWTSGGESAAVKQLADAYNKAGGQWVDNAIAGGDNARAAALNRIAGVNPPVASQFNTSKQYHELIDNDLLASVDDLAAKEGWDQWMPVPIKNVIKIKGHYYAVPVNIHSGAWFWYSKAVLAKAGVTEPKNEAEFWNALDKIKASGQIGFAQSGTLTYERATFTAAPVVERCSLSPK